MKNNVTEIVFIITTDGMENASHIYAANYSVMADAISNLRRGKGLDDGAWHKKPDEE